MHNSNFNILLPKSFKTASLQTLDRLFIHLSPPHGHLSVFPSPHRFYCVPKSIVAGECVSSLLSLLPACPQIMKQLCFATEPRRSSSAGISISELTQRSKDRNDAVIIMATYSPSISDSHLMPSPGHLALHLVLFCSLSAVPTCGLVCWECLEEKCKADSAYQYHIQRVCPPSFMCQVNEILTFFEG